MELFTLAGLISELSTSILQYHGLRKPEGFGFAAQTAHGQFEECNSLLCPLKLYDGVNEVDATIEPNHEPVILIIREITLVGCLILLVVVTGLNLICHLLVLLVGSIHAREKIFTVIFLIYLRCLDIFEIDLHFRLRT